MQRDEFVELGYEAARKIASRVNAGNANEFAATSIGNDVRNAIELSGTVNPVWIIRLQERCHVDLSPILMLDGKEQGKALALFAGGALRFHRDNPEKRLTWP
jgi:hypothetical protein